MFPYLFNQKLYFKLKKIVIMKTPRNHNQAIAMGLKISGVVYYNEKQILIKYKPRYKFSGLKCTSLWLTARSCKMNRIEY